MYSDASRKNDTVPAIAQDSITIGPAAYLTKIFGGITEDVLGLVVGDWLHEKRQQNLARLKRRTQEYLDTLDKSSVIEPSPSILLPLLRAAADEGREELQDLWAGLLSNTMTERGHQVRHVFIEILKGMEPDEASMLLTIYSISSQIITLSETFEGAFEKRKAVGKKMYELSMDRGLSHDDVLLSQQRLEAVQCISVFGPMEVELSPLGKALVLACQPAKNHRV